MTEEQQKLFDENQGLVHFCWRNMQTEALRPHYEDMIQEGYIGLFKAAKGWNAAKGIKFSTYAISTINGCMLTYKYKMVGNKNGINYGREFQMIIFKYLRLRENNLTSEEIAERLEISKEMAWRCEMYAISGGSIDIVIGNSTENHNQDTIGDRYYADACNVEQDFLDKEYEQNILDALNTYGNQGGKGNTRRQVFLFYAKKQLEGYQVGQQEIANILGTSQSLVSRSIKLGQKEFKDYLRKEGLYEPESVYASR